MRIIQAHNRHATRGGADVVMDQERDLLVGAGHEVQRFIVEAASKGDAKSAARAVWNSKTLRDAGELINRFRPDVVHVHTPFPLMSPTIFHAAYRRGVPAVATAHSFRITCIAGTLRRDGKICEDCVGRRIKAPAVRHSCYHGSVSASATLAMSLTLHHAVGTFESRVARYFAMTDFARDILIRDGIPGSRIVVKPNHVTDPGPPPAWHTRRPHVLFSGRLVEEKGIHTLLEAWSRLGLAGYVLRVCGDGPLMGIVADAARQDPTIQPLGWVSQERMLEEQRCAAVNVVPSEWYEAGPPLVLLDALATGTPVLCSDLRNISASVERSGAGETFRTGDAASLAERLRAMLADQQVLRHRGRSGRTLYESVHSPEHSLHILERAYEEVCMQSR